MKDQIDVIIKKTQRYWYVDGLSEIGAGVVIFLSGLFYLLVWRLPLQEAKALLLGLGMPLLIIAGCVGVRWLVGQAKERITYPRTGYIEYRRPKSGRRWVVGLVAGVISAGTTAILINFMPAVLERFIIAFTGVLVFFSLSLLSLRVGVWRLMGAGAAALAGGLAASWLDLPYPLNIALFLCAFGSAFLVSGGLTLRNYLARTRLPAQENEDE